MSLFLPACGPPAVLGEESGVPVSSSLGLWVDGTLGGRNEKSREGPLCRKRQVHVKPGIKAPGGGEDGAALLRCFRDCVLHSLFVLLQFSTIPNPSILWPKARFEAPCEVATLESGISALVFAHLPPEAHGKGACVALSLQPVPCHTEISKPLEIPSSFWLFSVSSAEARR